MDGPHLIVHIPHMPVESQWLATPPAPEQPRLLLTRLVRLSTWTLRDCSAPFWRCYLALEPGGELRWDGRDWPLACGEWLVMAPGTAAASTCRRPFRKAYAHLAWSPPGLRPRPGLWRGRLARGEAGVLARAAARAPGDAAGARALGLLIQAQACRALAAIADEALESAPAVGELVAAAMALLQRDPAVTPDNTTLGRLLACHPNHMVRCFSAELGTSPQRWARRWRLELAAARLAESEETIDAIAAATGFGDRHHFTRAFAAHWGQAPAAWRRQAR